MKRLLTISLIGVVGLIVVLGTIWFNTQPMWPVDRKIETDKLESLPVTNREVVEFIQAEGKDLAPTYESVVCTEFVIKVIDKIKPLTRGEKNDIRIITDSQLDSLVEADSPIIKGVQTALLRNNKGIEIKESSEVLPGDFVQFWKVFQGRAYGHCGIVLDIEPNKTLTLYSSHPFTGGYGTQEYLWPEKTYFVRLK
jgi:hypothetical protein